MIEFYILVDHSGFSHYRKMHDGFPSRLLYRSPRDGEKYSEEDFIEPINDDKLITFGGSYKFRGKLLQVKRLL